LTAAGRGQWLVPAGLIALSFVPVLAGAVRLESLATGAPVTADNARFVASPIPVVVHIIGATVYALLGAFQFVPAIRRRWPGWHRAAGRVLIPAGLAVALSGLWMAVFYPKPPDVGDLLTGFRLFFGAAMATCLVLGYAAIRRRRVIVHRAWMMRAYAIALGAGTQVFTQLPWLLVAGELGKLSKAMLMLAGWLINLAVAELAIRRGLRVAGTGDGRVP
jgi:uncharacterized membrane protein